MESYYEREEHEKDSYLRDLLKKISKKLAVFNILIITVMAIILIITFPYIKNAVKGPLTIDYMDIDKEMMETDLYYTINVPLDEQIVFETYYADENNNVTDYFGGILGNEMYIVTEFSELMNEAIPTTYTGRFKGIEADIYNSLKEEFVEAGFTDEEITSYLPEYKFVDGYNRAGIYVIFTGLGLLLLIVFFNLKNILKNRNFDTTPLFENLSQWGDPYEIEDEIEKLVESNQHTVIGRMTLVGDYLIVLHGSSYKAYLLNEIQWCFKKVIKQKRLFITIHTTYFVEFFTSSGKHQTIPLNKSQIDLAMAAISSAHPNCIYTMEKGFKKMWKNDNESFQKMIDEKSSEQINLI